MGKLPPQAPELEDSVLGALMIEKEAYGTVADLLTPESFYKDQNRIIFEAIRALASKDQPIDSLSVAEKLKRIYYCRFWRPRSYGATLLPRQGQSE